jgi:hypothetical protein
MSVLQEVKLVISPGVWLLILDQHAGAKTFRVNDDDRIIVGAFDDESSWSVALPKAQKFAEAVRRYYNDGDDAGLSALAEE